jgi:hypothetical protein
MIAEVRSAFLMRQYPGCGSLASQRLAGEMTGERYKHAAMPEERICGRFVSYWRDVLALLVTLCRRAPMSTLRASRRSFRNRLQTR